MPRHQLEPKIKSNTREVEKSATKMCKIHGTIEHVRMKSTRMKSPIEAGHCGNNAKSKMSWKDKNKLEM